MYFSTSQFDASVGSTTLSQLPAAQSGCVIAGVSQPRAPGIRSVLSSAYNRQARHIC